MACMLCNSQINDKKFHTKLNVLFQLCRWVLLIWGVQYGNERQKYLTELETQRIEKKRQKEATRHYTISVERQHVSEVEDSENTGRIIFDTD